MDGLGAIEDMLAFGEQLGGARTIHKILRIGGERIVEGERLTRGLVDGSQREVVERRVLAGAHARQAAA